VARPRLRLSDGPEHHSQKGTAMNVEDVLKYIFDAKTLAPLIVGIGLGYAVGVWYGRKVTNDLRSDLDRARDDRDKASGKLEKLEAKFEGEKRGWEYENAHYKAEIERLNARGKTIRCGICGSSMSKTKEYINNNYVGSPKYVDLKCTEQSCGQVLPTSLDDLIRITKKLNGAS
jgi:hypothetical protein